MNPTDAQREDECFTDYALQEYALGRLSEKIRAKTESHIRECRACHTTYHEIQREVACFQELETGRRSVGDCLRDEDLGLFLDGTGETTQRDSVLRHLQSCKSCTLTLVEMRREIAEALAQVDGLKSEAPSERGIVLTMPKRPEPRTDDPKSMPDFDLKGSDTGT